MWHLSSPRCHHRCKMPYATTFEIWNREVKVIFTLEKFGAVCWKAGKIVWERFEWGWSVMMEVNDLRRNTHITPNCKSSHTVQLCRCSTWFQRLCGKAWNCFSICPFMHPKSIVYSSFRWYQYLIFLCTIENVFQIFITQKDIRFTFLFSLFTNYFCIHVVFITTQFLLFAHFAMWYFWFHKSLFNSA